MKRTMLSGLLLLALWTAMAQERVTTLNEVEVNASKTKLSADLGRVVKVIYAEDIDKMAVRTIDELLKTIAGIDVRSRGIGGVQADLSIRGGSFDQTLILLNGINLNDPQTGHYNLDLPIDLSDVSRIEVLQGAASRLLGANAFSGAINIVTGEEKTTQLTSRHSAGSFGYLSQGIKSNIRHNNLTNLISVDTKRSRGYRENTDFEVLSAYANLKWKNKTMGLWDWQLGTQIKDYGANSFYSLAFPAQYEHTKSVFSALGWKKDLGRIALEADGYWRGHFDNFELVRHSTYGENFHLTNISGVNLKAHLRSSIGTTAVGIIWRNEHIVSTKLGKKTNDTIKAPFVENIYFDHTANRMLATLVLNHDAHYDQWDFSAGVSVTHNARFGVMPTYGMDIAYHLNAESRLYASANSGLRLPTFTDLYYNSRTTVSDSTLSAEKSMNLELGYKYQSHSLTLSSSLFYRKGDNIIDWIKRPNETVFRSTNLTRVNALGAEINAKYRWAENLFNFVSVNYAFVSLDKKSDGFDSKYALDYLRNKIVAEINHNVVENLSIGWILSYFDREGDYTLPKAKTNYRPYTLVDAKVQWQRPRYTLFLDVNNILNTQYADYGGLPMPGTNFQCGVKLRLY